MSVAVPVTTPDREKSAGPWIVNGPVDLLVGCGAWTIPLLIVTGYLNAAGTIALSFVFYFLSVFCNNPHYMATIYRAYGTPQDFRKYKLFTVYLTAILILTAIATHFAPLLLPILFTVYLTWSPWHYTGQNFGIAMMFARRAGASPTRGMRNLIYAAYLASYIVWFLNLHSTLAESPYILTLGIDATVAMWMSLGCFGVFFACAGVAHVSLVGRLGMRAMVPMLLLLLTQFCWFLFPVFLHLADLYRAAPIYYSTGVLAFMHCAQYLWITGYYTKREAQAGLRPPWRPVRYYVALVIGGIALFVPGPWLVSRVFSYNLVDSYLIFVALVNIHHFMLDGAIWKLRDGRIARLLLGSQGNAPEKNLAPDGWFEQAFKWASSPRPIARTARYGLVGGLVLLAVVDQVQYFRTLEGSGIDRFEQAISLNPSDARSHRQMARVMMEEGRMDEAERLLREAISLRGANVEERRMLANLLVSTGRPEEARELYRQIESVSRLDATALLNLGTIEATFGNSDEAEARFEEALQMDPARPDISLNLAELHFASGDFDAALPHYEQFIVLISHSDATESRRQTAYAALKMAESLAALGRYEEAVDTFVQSASIASSVEAHEVESRAMGRASEVVASHGDLETSLEWSLLALHAAAKAGNESLRALHLYHRATTLLALAQERKEEAAALLLLAREGPEASIRDAAEGLLQQIESRDPGTREAALARIDDVQENLIAAD